MIFLLVDFKSCEFILIYGISLHLLVAYSSSSSDDDEDDDRSDDQKDGEKSLTESIVESTMWLGTEDGVVHIYNCADSLRVKRNRLKIQHNYAVYCIL